MTDDEYMEKLESQLETYKKMFKSLAEEKKNPDTEVYLFYCERCDDTFVWTRFRKCTRCCAKAPVEKVGRANVKWKDALMFDGDVRDYV